MNPDRSCCHQRPVFNPEFNKFWMVVGIQNCGNGPKVMHDSEEKAEAEATRLAKQNPGVSFVVLESVTKCRATQPVEVQKYQ